MTNITQERLWTTVSKKFGDNNLEKYLGIIFICMPCLTLSKLRYYDNLSRRKNTHAVLLLSKSVSLINGNRNLGYKTYSRFRYWNIQTNTMTTRFLKEIVMFYEYSVTLTLALTVLLLDFSKPFYLWYKAA